MSIAICKNINSYVRRNSGETFAVPVPHLLMFCQIALYEPVFNARSYKKILYIMEENIMSNMVINTNVLALYSHRAMKTVGEQQAKASKRLSTGLRINSAADDAAGLAISEKMRSQIRGLNQASKNAQDAVSLIQTAEGGMQEIDNMLQRIRELVVQASNDTNEHNQLGTGDRQKMQDEVNQLVAEIDSMSERVEFNKKKVINGEYANPQEILDQRNKQLDAATTEQASAAVVSAAANTDLIAAQAAITTFANANYTAYTTELGNFQTSEKAFEKGFADITSDANYTLMLAEAVGAGAPAYGGTTANELYDYLKANAGTITTPAYATLATTFTGLGDTNVTNANNLKTATENWNADVTGQKDLRNLKLIESTAIKTKKAADKKLALTTKKLNTATALQIAATNAVIASAGNTKELYFQVGANSNQGLELNIGTIKSSTLGIGDGLGNTTIDLLKDTGAEITGVLDTIDTAISYVTTERSKLGAAQNRLEYTMKSLDISSENLSASESRIRDADMAKEMMDLTKANVLQQAAMSMLAQSNQAPQNILQLLR